MTRAHAWPQWLTFSIIAACGAALDLWTKEAVFAWRGLPGQQAPWWLIDGYVGVETAVNDGALFGMGGGFGMAFAWLSIAASLGILIWLTRFGAIHSWWLSVALGCVTAGILGNLYDRLGMWYQPGYPPQWQSGVRDWILFRYAQYTWPNFNIADSLLVTGAIMLAIHSFKSPSTIDSRSTAETAAGRLPPV